MYKNRFPLLTSLGLLTVFLAGSLSAGLQPLSDSDPGTPAPAPASEINEPVCIYCDLDEAAVVFAARDLKRILGKLGTIATLRPSYDLSDTPTGVSW